VRLIPVDFETDDWTSRLTAAGFDRSRHTLLTWLGVSYYLTATAVARTLEQAAALCAPGNRLVFDYVTASVLAVDTGNRAARTGFRHAARVGEPFLFGLEPAKVGAYLAQFGFRLTKQYDGHELQRRYCPPGRKPVDFARIVVCQRRETL
jgi:methyltransferase (TIGR00027 family)